MKRWLPFHRPAGAGRLRLFCFPFVGGGPAAFRAWPNGLPGLDVCALEYPGRWTRRREPPSASVPLLVRAIANDLKAVLEEPFVFLGVSYGALVAFELTRELRRRGAPLPDHLFACAANAPQWPRALRPIASLPDAPLIAEFGHRYGALPATLLADPEVRGLVLEILRADLTAYETYTYQHEAPLPCPITVLDGRDDSVVDRRAADAWRHQTAARFALHMLPGDHFFINTATEDVFQIVLERLAAARV